MKLIIEIPEDVYNDMIKWVKVDGNFCSLVDEAIANGTPLEKHDEEVIKETVASVWGKPPCDDAISRKAVLEILQDYVFEEDEIESVTDECQNNMAESIARNIVQLPPVYPQNTEVLDKIRAEIERYQADCNLSCSDDANCRICDKITFDTIYRIIDKYRKGQTNADSD